MKTCPHWQQFCVGCQWLELEEKKWREDKGRCPIIIELLPHSSTTVCHTPQNARQSLSCWNRDSYLGFSLGLQLLSEYTFCKKKLGKNSERIKSVEWLPRGKEAHKQSLHWGQVSLNFWLQIAQISCPPLKSRVNLNYIHQVIVD